MSGEILSTARPSALRLVGFLCLALGAIAAGVGATSPWVRIGFPADVERVADVAVHGTDVWEGKVVLLVAVVALIGIVAVRVAGSDPVRRGLAVLLVVVGLAVLALPAIDAVRAEDRFGGTQGTDLLAERLAAELELPEDLVRAQLAEEFARALRVDLERGIWISAFGGLLLALGGILTVRWARGRRAGAVAAVAEPSAPTA